MTDNKPGDKVILQSVPPGLLQNLPEVDQSAIKSIIGQPVRFAGYSFDGAELEFVDESGASHSIWVESCSLLSVKDI